MVGPWHLDVVTDELHRSGADVHYVVLRPRLEVCLARAGSRAGEERVTGHPPLTDQDPVRHMWEQFSALGPYESYVIDNGALDAEQAATVVWTRFVDGTDRL
jgi:hypothetical protein